MKYKLIATDFDGTLLNDDGMVIDKNKEALLTCKENGYLIVGVTGRNISSARKVVDFDMFDYLILNNGAYLYDVKNNNGFYIDSINKDCCKEIVKIIGDASSQIEFISATTYYIYKEKRNSPVSFIKDIESIDEVNEDIARISVFLDNQDNIDYYLKLINEKFKNINCFIMKYSDRDLKWLAINPGILNKMETLRQLGMNLGITSDEMIFFGDSSNDLEAIEGVGCGVAMGNAIDEVKEKADYVTLTNNEDGVAVFLEKKQPLFYNNIQ